MATRNTGRTLWKGAISFGLVHIPVGLYTATRDEGIDFDWLDKRTMDPVGYKRINKKTGKEIDKDQIVKGVETDDGEYVVVSDKEIEDAFPRATQTIEIERFVDAAEIPFLYLERPYYVAPIHKGRKVYLLLREALVKTGKVGIAKVVIHTKQHLAALIPSGQLLVLNLLRWGNEVKSVDELELPDLKAGSKAFSASEMKMATQLIDEMTGTWSADDFKDEFREQVMAMVREKAEKGETETVDKQQEAPARSADIIDLGELLKRSLQGGRSGRSAAGAAKDEPGTKAADKAKGARKAASSGKTGAASGRSKSRKAA